MSTLEKIISRRRRGLDASTEDFLQRLLAEDDNSCSDGMHRLTDAEIQDNILTMIIAGDQIPRTKPFFALMTLFIHDSFFFFFLFQTKYTQPLSICFQIQVKIQQQVQSHGWSSIWGRMKRSLTQLRLVENQIAVTRQIHSHSQ